MYLLEHIPLIFEILGSVNRAVTQFCLHYQFIK